MEQVLFKDQKIYLEIMLAQRSCSHAAKWLKKMSQSPNIFVVYIQQHH